MNETVNILIAGDTHLGGGRVKELALQNAIEPLFGNFLGNIQNAHLAITNLESPLVDQAESILKIGPNLKSPVSSIRVLQKAGFDLVTLANNHIMDFGEKGLKSTLQACSKAGIATVGAGLQLQKAKEPYLFEINDIRIGILNIAENEFGTTTNGSPGAHALNPVQNYYLIKEIAAMVQHLIIIVHGGHERYPLPSPRMKETYRFFVDAGAAVVIGHHPHCYSGYEIYNEAPIFYSLGNFMFDKGRRLPAGWNEGYIVELKLDAEAIRFEVIPYVQNAEEAGLKKLTEKERDLFEENLEQINTIIAADDELEERFLAFCESSRRQYSSYIEPHSNRYLHALRNRNLFPSLIGNRKKRLLLNLTRCEAHRDVLKKILAE